MEPSTAERSGEKYDKIAALFTALRFLTIIPVRWNCDRDGELFRLSLFYFVVVGLLIGCMGMVVCHIAASFFPLTVVAFSLIFFLSAISGFLHLDGLADSADGLLSSRPRERSLAIMKDSRTGAMGVVALLLILLGKFAALSVMPPAMLVTAALCMPVAGRCAIVITMAVQHYARPEGGLGSLFYSAGTRYAAVVGSGILLLATILHSGIQLTTIVVATMVFTVAWFSLFCKTRLGGVTGDTLGAVCELTEMSVAIALTAFI